MVACLVEKQRTTPDQYPLTLNSLRLACNQSTNRDPVVDYDEATIRSALDRLGRRKWTTLASWSTARSVKYKHLLDQALGLERRRAGADDRADAARPADARRAARAQRAHPPLRVRRGARSRRSRELAERELAVALPRRPGERGQRYAHLVGARTRRSRGVGARRGRAAAPPSRRPPATASPRVERLEREVAALREQLRAAARRARRLAGRPALGDLATSGAQAHAGARDARNWAHAAPGGPAGGAARACHSPGRTQHAVSRRVSAVGSSRAWRCFC